MVHPTLAKAPAVTATQAVQSASAPELAAITRRDFSASGVRVASHRFPALLDDERESAVSDTRTSQRRQRLDAEQEGRAWNG